MRFPDCFYQKAFWIIIPIIFASIGSGVIAINNQIAALDERVTSNQVTIARNNVPELKETVNAIDEKVDAILINQARLEGKIERLLP
jgi:SUMO ligase MMS21 Smc5/6 complex component